jgi:error-prone DNA polymerase
VRDAARVLGFSVEQADMLATLSDRFSARATAEALRATPADAGASDAAVANALSSAMVRGTEATTRSRAEKEKSKQVAKPMTSADRPKPNAAYEPYGSPSAQSSGARSLVAIPQSMHHAADRGNRWEDPHADDSHDERRNPTTALRPTGGASIVERAGLDPDDKRVRALAEIVEGLHQLPRHRSIHVGGFVLTAEPLSSVVPIEPASMPGRTVIQWEKDDLDPVGLVKIDLLGLGMLTLLQDCLLYIRQERGVTIDLATLDMTDQAVYDDLCNADTIGVFQVESRAQMNTLPRLKPRCFYDLVVEVALIRPGPIQGEMVHPYLRRKNGQEEVTYPHPSLKPILERTLGVPLFQEQGMQVAIAAAGFTPGESDQLRRAMGHKRSRERMAAICQKMIDGMEANGIAPDVAQRIYNQINAFADYGFPESHAASFALLVYASAWLKVHYPAEFAAALVNSQPMGFYSPSTILQDAQRHGVQLAPLDVGVSDWDCVCMRPDPSRPTWIRLGLRLVSGLGEDAGRRIEKARAERPFASSEDLTARARLDKRELVLLAESGALDELCGSRRDAIWKVVAPRPISLFEGTDNEEARPALARMSRAEQLVLDYERTGVSVSDHPMKLLRPRLPKKTRSSRDILSLRSGTKVSVAGMVICRQRPGTASGVVFVTMEDEYGFSNLVLWSRVFEQYREIATGSRLLMVHGRIERSDDQRSTSARPVGYKPADPNAPASVVYVIAERLERLDAQLPALDSMSRDFH